MQSKSLLEAPAGYRLLVQCFDAQTPAEAKEYVRKVFGEFKSQKAVYLPGTYTSITGRSWDRRWNFQHEGYRAFVPIALFGSV